MRRHPTTRTTADSGTPPRPPVVLCFHAISDEWPSVLAVSVATLRRRIEALLRAGMVARTFSEAVMHQGPARAFAVTFDDAFASVAERGLPALRSLGVPATVFVPTGLGDRPRPWGGLGDWMGGPWEAELSGANRDQLLDLVANGWEIGSHTRTHPRLPELGDDALADELTRSRHECEALSGRPCESIAYPYGDQDERTREAARFAGYRAGATVLSWRTRLDRAPDLMSWPRVGIQRDESKARIRAKMIALGHPRTWNLVAGMRGGRGS